MMKISNKSHKSPHVSYILPRKLTCTLKNSGWKLEDYFPFEMSPFQGNMLVFEGATASFLHKRPRSNTRYDSRQLEEFVVQPFK